MPPLPALITTSVTPPAIPHGQPAAITLTLTPGQFPVAGLQFSVTLPTGWTIGVPMLTPLAASVPKFLVSQQANGSLFCLIYGLSLSSIPPGQFIVIPVTGPVGTPPGSANVALTGEVASDPNGLSVPITGTGASVSVERHHWWRRQKRKNK